MQEDILLNYLQKHFRHKNFQEGQREIIGDVLEGKDVLGVLHTGSGKSLCYQFPAKMLPGTCLVVSPLISLMIDQVREVKSLYFKEAVALHSFQNKQERSKILRQLKNYKLVYVSPELLQQEDLIRRLLTIKISLFVIDEAHCISQWGYDFRPDYLRLTDIIKRLNNPPTLALTGTATPKVQRDIMNKLGKSHMEQHVYPMDRENISLLVHHVEGGEDEKRNILTSLISSHTEPTVIYFSSRKMAETIASLLAQRVNNRKIAYYHGGMENADRLKIQQQFMQEQIDVICCTSAFGMGINKKNIRMVIHYHMPTQIESYIQEIGRAGRDGKESISLLLYRAGDEQIPLQIIENELPTEKEIASVMNQLYLLHQKRHTVPLSDDANEQLFQIDSVKWRFLHYQFEAHGMIEKDKILYNKENWEASYHKIINFCKDRNNKKRKQLDDIIFWVHTNNCLRSELYKDFQKTICKKDSQCCSNCGFSFEDWIRDQHSEIKEPKHQPSWETVLKEKLLVGEAYETS